ncbi:MAG: hypothetical protein ABIK28_04420 [Planctomycetota bacterium]
MAKRYESISYTLHVLAAVLIIVRPQYHPMTEERPESIIAGCNSSAGDSSDSRNTVVKEGVGRLLPLTKYNLFKITESIRAIERKV